MNSSNQTFPLAKPEKRSFFTSRTFKITCGIVSLIAVVLAITATVFATTFKQPQFTLNSQQKLSDLTSARGSTDIPNWILDVGVRNLNRYSLEITKADGFVAFDAAPNWKFGNVQLPLPMSMAANSNGTYRITVVSNAPANNEKISDAEKFAAFGQVFGSCLGQKGTSEVSVTVKLDSVWAKVAGMGPFSVGDIKI